MIEKEIHPAQAEILRALLFKKSARFGDLNLAGLSSDHLSFHIGRLVEVNLIEKIVDGYTLTTRGKEFANRMDTDTAQMEKQAKTTVMVVATRKRNGVKEYLVQQRLKQPYFEYHGFVSGKIKWGEKVLTAALRELYEETRLSGKPKLMAIEHKMDVKEVVLEDKYFYLVRVTQVKGDLMENFEGGRNLWLSEEKLFKLPKLFDDMREILRLINGSSLGFMEKEFSIEEY